MTTPTLLPPPANLDALVAMAQLLVAGDKGLLAIDESIPTCKVDLGAKPMARHPVEKVTEGLNGLRQRLSEYAGMGARFAKWRTVFTIANRDARRGEATSTDATEADPLLTTSGPARPVGARTAATHVHRVAGGA